MGQKASNVFTPEKQDQGGQLGGNVYTGNGGASQDALGYYGAGGTSGPTANDRKAFDVLGGVSGYNYQTPQVVAGLGDKVLDRADQGNANIRDWSIKNAKRKSANEWYKSQQDLQSVTSQLADASGNLANGSGFYDFLDLIARRDDQQDVEVLNTARDNENAIWSDFWEALQANNNSRNNMYVDAQEAMRNVAADYVAQGNSIHPDLVQGMVDGGNHTLKLPDWLNSDGWAENRFRDPVNPTMNDFFRPANDAGSATKNGLVDREPNTTNQPAANQSYWDRMRAGYRRRNQ